LIFQRTGRVAKTHSGGRGEFARLVRDEARISPDMPGFLARSYQYKEVSDYGIDPGEIVTMEQAEEAIRVAEQFIEDVRTILE
jgi:uncharacterized protein (UPF0332 family)